MPDINRDYAAAETPNPIAERKPEPLMEMFDGKLREVINPDRQGWWRFHDHYDRNGYCDNPARGY